MCGIFGMVSRRKENLRFPGAMAAMGRAIRHRGPDSRRIAELGSAALGCERLRIIDLRDRADSPFHDQSAQNWMACNGEIYNSTELRQLYPDYPYVSRSDIEVILPLFEHRGVDGFAQLDGMFGLALWSQRSGSLILARDRAGEKPLFYTTCGPEVWFASEIQALLCHPSISRDLDQQAVDAFLTLGYVPGPRTIFSRIRKVEPGTSITFTSESEVTSRYWDPIEIAKSTKPHIGSVEELRTLLEEAVHRQMVADVDVGVFLSGGMDSALIASIASRHRQNGPLRTFTVRSTESSYDEGELAARHARHIGSLHHEVMVDEAALARALGAVVAELAEPLADPALLPTYLLAEEACRHVKVILSGEGADELFGGYPTYLGHRFARRYLAVPKALRSVAKSLIDALPASRKKVTLDYVLKRFLSGVERPWPDRHFTWFGTGRQANGALRDLGPQGLDQWSGSASDAMLLDYCTYLPDDLLTKNDRATMLHSVEARSPFLDRALSTYALNLQEQDKLRGSTQKWLLKKAARKWLPDTVLDQRKRGLSVPVADFLDRGFRGEADRLLHRERLENQQIIDPDEVRTVLEQHRSKQMNHGRYLWAVVVLQTWLDHWGTPAETET